MRSLGVLEVRKMTPLFKRGHFSLPAFFPSILYGTFHGQFSARRKSRTIKFEQKCKTKPNNEIPPGGSEWYCLVSLIRISIKWSWEKWLTSYGRRHYAQASEGGQESYCSSSCKDLKKCHLWCFVLKNFQQTDWVIQLIYQRQMSSYFLRGIMAHFLATLSGS